MIQEGITVVELFKIDNGWLIRVTHKKEISSDAVDEFYVPGWDEAIKYLDVVVRGKL
jgi:hypothetical protein